jgi:hypothetical protein
MSCRISIAVVALVLASSAVAQNERIKKRLPPSETLAATAGFADLVLKDEEAKPLLYRDE